MGKGKRNKEIKKLKNKKEEEEILHIRENHKTITISDFWEIHQIMRSDFYLLDSLRLILENSIFALENSNHEVKLVYEIKNIKAKAQNFHEEIIELTKEYSNLDQVEKLNENLNNNQKTEINQEVALSQESNLNVLNFDNKHNAIPYFETLISCIKLSEKIESKSNDILHFLYKINAMNNEILSIESNDLRTEFSLRKSAEIFKYGFEVSTDKDKIINYEIKCEDNNIINILSKKYDLDRTKESFILKKRDLRYINSIIQKRVIVEYEEFGNTFKRSIQLERNKQAKILNRILFYIAVIAVGSQLLNLPEDYSSFYEKLRPYLEPIYIKGLAIGIIVLIFIVIFLAEKIIFKEFEQYEK